MTYKPFCMYHVQLKLKIILVTFWLYFCDILYIQGLKKEMVTMVKKIEVLEVHNRFVYHCHICFQIFYDRVDFQVVTKGCVSILKMWLC